MADLDEIVQRMAAQQRAVYGAVEALFGVTAGEVPEPKLFCIGASASVNLGNPVPNVEGLYDESERLILINPARIVKVCSQQKKSGANIHPNYQIARVLGKEYGQHIYSFLHGFNLVETVDRLLNTDKSLFCKLTIEAIGVVSMIETYFRLSQRDNHPASVNNSIRRGKAKDASDLQKLMGAYLELGVKLHALGADSFKKFVRMDVPSAAKFGETLYKTDRMANEKPAK